MDPPSGRKWHVHHRSGVRFPSGEDILLRREYHCRARSCLAIAITITVTVAITITITVNAFTIATNVRQLGVVRKSRGPTAKLPQ